MAIESNGIQFHRLSSAIVASNASTKININPYSICGTEATTDFIGRGFSTAHWIRWTTSDLSAVSTVCLSTCPVYRIKSVDTTVIGFYGVVLATVTTWMALYGYTSTEIYELVNFSGPSANSRVIDATPVDSSVARTNTVLPRFGEISLNMNFAATHSGQSCLRSDFESNSFRTYAIVFTDETSGSSAYPSYVTFGARCSGYSLNVAVDNKIEANAQLVIDGPMWWSTRVNV